MSSGAPSGSKGGTGCKITSSGVVRAAHASVSRSGLQQRRHVLAIQGERRPRVTELDGAPQRAGRLASDPDRHVGCRGSRVDHEVVELVVRASVDGLGAPEGGAQRPDRIVGSGAAVAERRVEELELFDERADAHTQDEAAVRDAVERSVPLHDRERVVVSEDEHEGREPNRGGPRGQVAERGEGIPVRAAAFLGDLSGHADVLAARAEVVPEPLGLDDDLVDLGDAGVGLPLRVRAAGASGPA